MNPEVFARVRGSMSVYVFVCVCVWQYVSVCVFVCLCIKQMVCLSEANGELRPVPVG